MSCSARILLSACVVLSSAGCNSTMQTMTAGGTLSPALSTEPAITAADIAMLKSMSRVQQLAHLAISDSMEIAMARIAMQRTRHDAVAAFARRMMDEHGASLQSIDLIARHEHIKLQPASTDTMPAHLSRMVQALDAGTPDAEFDGTYVLSQIQLHQYALDELQALQDIATDPSLHQRVNESIPMAESHLASARHIAATLGYTTAR